MKNALPKLAALLFVLLASPLPAYEIVPDRIYVDGIDYRTYVDPLRSFFERYPEKQPSFDYYGPEWRHPYLAQYTIEDGALNVADLSVLRLVDGKSELVSVLEEVFPDEGSRRCVDFSGVFIFTIDNVGPNDFNFTWIDADKTLVIVVLQGRVASKRWYAPDEALRLKTLTANEYAETEGWRLRLSELPYWMLQEEKYLPPIGTGLRTESRELGTVEIIMRYDELWDSPEIAVIWLRLSGD